MNHQRLVARERWKKFLESIQCPQDWLEQLEQLGQLEPIRVHAKQSSWTFVVHCSALIPAERLSVLIAQLETQYGCFVERLRFIVMYDNAISTGTIVEMYWPFCLQRLALPLLESIRLIPSQQSIELRVSDESLLKRCQDKQVETTVRDFYHTMFDRWVEVTWAVDPPEQQWQRLHQARDAEIVELLQQSTPSLPSHKNENHRVVPDSLSTVPILAEGQKIQFTAKIIQSEQRVLRNGKTCIQWLLSDETSESEAIFAKIFLADEEKLAAVQRHELGHWVRVKGKLAKDAYMDPPEMTVIVSTMESAEDPTIRDDHATHKRIEYHVHTVMSTMDAVSSIDEYVQRIKRWGHRGVAVTDHMTVQAYPDAAKAGKKYGVDIFYGIEANVVDDEAPWVQRADDRTLQEITYVVFDFETTGLSVRHHRLIEWAAVKIRNGVQIDEFSTMIQPGCPIPEMITRLTGITEEMVKDAPSLRTAVEQFMAWCGKDDVLVAHNAPFDVGFLDQALSACGYAQSQWAVIDTLEMARILFPSLKNHRLNTLAKKLDVVLEDHHRAIHDTRALAQLFLHFLKMLPSTIPHTLTGLLSLPRDVRKMRPFHCTVFARNEQGKRQLYDLVSQSHTRYLGRVPVIPKSWLRSHRHHFILFSGCEKGELFEAVVNKSDDVAKHIAQFYDVLEIQPLCMYEHWVEKQMIEHRSSIEEALRTIVTLGLQSDKPVVATGNVHYAEPHQHMSRNMLIHGITGFSPLKEQQLPAAHLRTTEEMLTEFSFLGADVAQEVVITAPNRVATWFESFSLFPNKLFTPHIEGADHEMETRCVQKAQSIYGDPLPEVVAHRLQKELRPIIQYGFSANYLISERLVRKSNEDGYLVGSRGSVGSSLVATLLDISEVNPLPSHYVCPSCRYSEWIDDPTVRSGYDLPEKHCPQCATPLKGEGQDIPFETFLGFQGDKVPDIDLNFSGEYQATAHAYTKQLFGEGNVFRAGTIGTVAEKTAISFVKKYAMEKELPLRQSQILRLALGCTGARRSTGQHPGGIIVVPNDLDIHEITPYQYPADDASSTWCTTHFDYHAFENNLLKLDILGHDDPTMMRMMQELTGIDPRTIPMNDPQVIALFSSTEPLGLTPESIRSSVATFGIPEMGTRFVRQMLMETKPSSFADLIQISGLSHGTGVWVGNAQELIQSETCTIKTVIGCRDDIMLYLHHIKGMDALLAFKIMENVRKGKRVPQEWVAQMEQHDVPPWYIESCQRIDYMFPKAHAAAYVISAVRCAYYKLYHPIAFYAAYFSIRADDVELDVLTGGYDAILRRIQEIESKGFSAPAKEKNSISTLEVALEMTARGYKFRPLDILRSDAFRFRIHEQALIPPFRIVPGLGESAAGNILQARSEYSFVSIEDFRLRTKVSKTVIELLEQRGCFQQLPKTNQLTFF